MTKQRPGLRSRLLQLVKGGERDDPHASAAAAHPGSPAPAPPRTVRGNRVVENATVVAETIYGGTAYVLANPLEDLTVRRSRFESWQSPVQRTLEERPTVRRLHIERCHFTVSDLGPLIVEDSVLDTIWLHRGKWGPQEVDGSVFKHVIVRGRITGSVRLSAYPLRYWGDEHRAARDQFTSSNAAYYRSVDWALDISQAEFTSFENERADIPARLYRQDPETQVIITRESCDGREWRAACEESYLWAISSGSLETRFADTVVVAPKRNRRFASVMAAIGRLRDIGVVVPD